MHGIQLTQQLSQSVRSWPNGQVAGLCRIKETAIS
jgi:hypothetical protein